MKKIDGILIKIQWLIILIAGIFLLFHGHNHDFVIVLWVYRCAMGGECEEED